MFINTIISLIFLCFNFVRCDDQPYCYMEDTNPYQYFGTKTSYSFSRGPDLEILQPHVCKPIYIWALIRHGTRYSSKVEVRKSNELQSQIVSNHETYKRGTLCFKDLKNLKQWLSQGYGKSTDDLAPQGRADLIDLGKRIAIKFEGLITNTTNNIGTTTKPRTKDSAAAFIEGMFGVNPMFNNSISISLYEDVLHFLDLSEEYQRRVAKNSETFKEKELFLKTKYMQSLMREVSDHLGFNESLPEKFIRHMYFSCAFENAWSPNSSPAFCAAFTKQQLQVLEYFYFDLPDYYEVGYGSLYNVKMRSPVVEDLLSNMIAVTKSENGPVYRAHFHFSHSAVLTHTITKLGLYRDEEPLLHSNYGSRKPKWAMHTISPFSGNLIAVLYKCDKKTWLEQYEIALYHNEYLVQIPDCPTGLCPLSQFVNSVRSNNVDLTGEDNSNAGVLSTQSSQCLSIVLTLILTVIHHCRHFK